MLKLLVWKPPTISVIILMIWGWDSTINYLFPESYTVSFLPSAHPAVQVGSLKDLQPVFLLQCWLIFSIHVNSKGIIVTWKLRFIQLEFTNTLVPENPDKHGLSFSMIKLKHNWYCVIFSMHSILKLRHSTLKQYVCLSDFNTCELWTWEPYLYLSPPNSPQEGNASSVSAAMLVALWGKWLKRFLCRIENKQELCKLVSLTKHGVCNINLQQEFKAFPSL